jgi:phosphopantetheinyl transferase
LQILTPLLPAQLSYSVELACCRVDDRYSLNVLTHQEKMRCNSFGSTSRRLEYLSSRWLVHKMAEHLELDPDRFLLKKDDTGQPFAEYQTKRYNVSIAHSVEDTICAVSSTVQLGIDLEPKGRSVAVGLPARLLNESEYSLFSGQDTLRMWTLKEAILKLKGSGLRTRLKDWKLISNDQSLFTAENREKERVNIYSFSYQNNWIALAFNPQNKFKP